MSKEELSFEELPDGSKIITIKGINQFGEKYIRQERIKCPSVWDALKRLTYTAEDMQNFAEWCADSLYEYIGGNRWKSYDLNRIATTTHLRELWEKKRKEATE